MRATDALAFGGEPCHVQAVMERAAAGLHDDRDDVELAAVGRRGARGREPVLGRMELRPLRRRARPVVRAAHVLDRPGVGRQVVAARSST